ncbi:hypothetical protein AHMF7605_23030 [Adhaeribacter arboris]|uniref:Photosynthesis system II assembly factor Ycf48/Hcf136-like domain-containing protein n=1 Tax=Adhaeribacter arboris TaxID=2072846 RepID=A0A2T2YKZ4_9BACT|nr:hypothetical protein [Adhaeribacter arboris]PSR56171.1 hypothetical protein AHMF7605_23030 [Adhaeribacter arboris]
MKGIFFWVFTTLFLFSCNSKKKNDEDKINSKIIVYGSKEWEKRRIEESARIRKLAKKKYPSATYDLLPITKDTLIAATQYNGLVLTMDAGKTWNEVATPGLIIKMTIDVEGRIWGIHSWQGIHEADRSTLYLSNNKGRSWITYELDTKELFPADFYSQPNEPLKIIDYNNKIYKLVDTSSELKWTIVDSISNSQESPNPWIRKEFVKDAKGRKWMYNRGGIFLIGKDTVKVY